MPQCLQKVALHSISLYITYCEQARSPTTTVWSRSVSHRALCFKTPFYQGHKVLFFSCALQLTCGRHSRQWRLQYANVDTKWVTLRVLFQRHSFHEIIFNSEFVYMECRVKNISQNLVWCSFLYETLYSSPLQDRMPFHCHHLLFWLNITPNSNQGHQLAPHYCGTD